MVVDIKINVGEFILDVLGCLEMCAYLRWATWGRAVWQGRVWARRFSFVCLTDQALSPCVSIMQNLMPDSDAAQSLVALDRRLHRLQHYLTGGSALQHASSPHRTIQSWLARLERRVSGLASQSTTVKQLLELRRSIDHYRSMIVTYQFHLRIRVSRIFPPFDGRSLFALTSRAAKGHRCSSTFISGDIGPT